MKLAVLADIHGNLRALERVAAHIEEWQPDQVVVAGDIVNRGPRPRACLEFVQQRQTEAGWRVVRGNHEDYIIAYDDPETAPKGLEFEIYRCAYWTYRRLDQDVSALEAMPFQVSLTAPDGSEARVVHASVRHNRDGIFPRTADNELRRKIYVEGKEPPPLLCVGHTHQPLIRRLDETLVVNVGAVGLPFDDDPRAAYAQLTWQTDGWQARIIRLPYDRDQAEQDFFESGFLHESGPLARLILDELRSACSRLYQWTVLYQDRVLAGEISLEEAVTRFLAECYEKENRTF